MEWLLLQPTSLYSSQQCHSMRWCSLLQPGRNRLA